MDVRHGIVVTGGRAPEGPVSFSDRGACLVVAADSGVDTAIAKGITPDAVVGDMDSLSVTDLTERFPKATVERFDRAKDWTDTEIALEFLWKRSIREITIVGGGGGRLDHLLGILALFERDRYPRRWFTDREVVTLIDGDVSFTAAAGETLSFFPVGPDVAEMSTSGLRWPLDRFSWRHGDAGVSNECRGGACRVSMRSGRLLMVRALPSPVLLP